MINTLKCLSTEGDSYNSSDKKNSFMLVCKRVPAIYCRTLKNVSTVNC